eukprot:scaffold62765_cov53-Attheya_sp.AAC.2
MMKPKRIIFVFIVLLGSCDVAAFGITKRHESPRSVSRLSRISRKSKEEDVDWERDDDRIDARERRNFPIEELEELDRTSLRLDGLETYVIVGALISTSSFECVYQNNIAMNGNLFNYATLFIGGFATLFSLYSTMIFASCVLYGRTSVGMKRDRSYANFMRKTQDIRISGFKALDAGLLLFSVDVVLVLAERVPWPVAIPWLVCGLALVAKGYATFQDIVDAARPIFTGTLPSDDDLLDEQDSFT